VPANRWRVEDYYEPGPHGEGQDLRQAAGAFLSPVAFDTLGFGMPPNSVAATDTSQLLALIAAEHVLADATSGDLDSLDRERVSVVLGTRAAGPVDEHEQPAAAPRMDEGPARAWPRRSPGPRRSATASRATTCPGRRLPFPWPAVQRGRWGGLPTGFDLHGHQPTPWIARVRQLASRVVERHERAASSRPGGHGGHRGSGHPSTTSSCTCASPRRPALSPSGRLPAVLRRCRRHDARRGTGNVRAQAAGRRRA